MFYNGCFLKFLKIKIAFSTYHVPKGFKCFSSRSESPGQPAWMAVVSRFIFPLRNGQTACSRCFQGGESLLSGLHVPAGLTPFLLSGRVLRSR